MCVNWQDLNPFKRKLLKYLLLEDTGKAVQFLCATCDFNLCVSLYISSLKQALSSFYNPAGSSRAMEF